MAKAVFSRANKLHLATRVFWQIMQRRPADCRKSARWIPAAFAANETYCFGFCLRPFNVGLIYDHGGLASNETIVSRIPLRCLIMPTAVNYRFSADPSRSIWV